MQCLLQVLDYCTQYSYISHCTCVGALSCNTSMLLKQLKESLLDLPDVENKKNLDRSDTYKKEDEEMSRR